MTTKTETSAPVALAALVAVVAVCALAVMLRGWVLTYLWAWFVMPFGIQPIGMAWAIGLSGLAGLMTPNHLRRDDGEGDKVARMTKAMGLIISLPLGALGVGWITHAIMVAA